MARPVHRLAEIDSIIGGVGSQFTQSDVTDPVKFDQMAAETDEELADDVTGKKN